MHLWVSFIIQGIMRITQAEICNIYSVTRKLFLLEEKQKALGKPDHLCWFLNWGHNLQNPGQAVHSELVGVSEAELPVGQRASLQ